MSRSLPEPPEGRQSPSRDLDSAERSQSCDLFLADLKQAMVDTGWTVDALAAQWQIHRSYVQRMLDGEKPITAERIVALPDDLEGRFLHLRTERFGRIVVEPLSGAAAQRAFVAGVLGLLNPQASALPSPNGASAKVDIAPAAKAVNK